MDASTEKPHRRASSAPVTIDDPVSLQEAAALLGVHKNTLRERAFRGRYAYGEMVTANGVAYVLSRAVIEQEARLLGRLSNGETPSKELDPTPTLGHPRALEELVESVAERVAAPLRDELRAVLADHARLATELALRQARVVELEARIQELDSPRRSLWARIWGK